MCGIAGLVGKKKINPKTIKACLKSMKQRGPDNQKSLFLKSKKTNINFLHSRLSIIDIHKRSDQPFQKYGISLIFNGEIYNYEEIKVELIKKGYNFLTESDTEVIITAYYEYKTKCFELFRGMWSIVLWDNNKNKLVLSRDRFGEKPLYYFFNGKNLIFGSQIKQIFILSEKTFKIEKRQIYNYLGLGYRSIYKHGLNFFKGINTVEPSSYLIFENNKIKTFKYWKLNYKPNFKIRENEIKKNIREKLINAIKRTSIAHVPISVLLSGGIDSNLILSVLNKYKKKKYNCFSVIDKDQRYNELKEINLSLSNNNAIGNKLYLKRKNFKFFIKSLQRKINYNFQPMYTITSYVSSQLHKKINKKNIKVSLTGIGADEIFAGYYEHTLYFLAEMKNHKIFRQELKSWERNILPLIRNPHLRNFDNFKKNKRYAKHVYLTNPLIKNVLKTKKTSLFYEKKFCNDALRNRMLNQLFYETVPPMLNEEDQNQMYSSVENRSPFLDMDLVKYLFTIPTKFLIKDSMTKFLIRDNFKEFVGKEILNNRHKKGFNASIKSLVSINENTFNKFLSNKKMLIYKFVKYEKVRSLFCKKKLENSESMFIFRFLNCMIFLESFYD